MRLVSIALLLLASSASAEETEDPGKRMLDRIEAKLVLPAGAYPLKSYTRAYAWSEGRTKVKGAFSRGPNRRYWVPEAQLPLVMDGGCAYIDVVYDVRTGLASAACHGEA